MNIFATVKTYKAVWEQDNSYTRKFNAEELAGINDTAVVVEGQWGLNVKFTTKDGSSMFFSLSTDSALGLGETIDVKNLLLLRYTRGEQECFKVVEEQL